MTLESVRESSFQPPPISKDEKRFRKGGRASPPVREHQREKEWEWKVSRSSAEAIKCAKEGYRRDPCPATATKETEEDWNELTKIDKGSAGSWRGTDMITVSFFTMRSSHCWTKICFNVKNSILFKYREFQTFLAFIFHLSECAKP